MDRFFLVLKVAKPRDMKIESAINDAWLIARETNLAIEFDWQDGIAYRISPDLTGRQITRMIADANRQEAEDKTIIKHHITRPCVPCPNCGTYRNVFDDVMQRCPDCGDDETDLSAEVGP